MKYAIELDCRCPVRPCSLYPSGRLLAAGTDRVRGGMAVGSTAARLGIRPSRLSNNLIILTAACLVLKGCFIRYFVNGYGWLRAWPFAAGLLQGPSRPVPVGTGADRDGGDTLRAAGSNHLGPPCHHRADRRGHPDPKLSDLCHRLWRGVADARAASRLPAQKSGRPSSSNWRWQRLSPIWSPRIQTVLEAGMCALAGWSEGMC